MIHDHVAGKGSAMEHVVLLDESGNARGRHEKGSAHGASTPLHLAFSCYIFDSRGSLLTTRRAAGKKTWPGIWTNSVCGHPQEGEPLLDAVLRRAAFELGLALDDLRLVLPDFRYRAELDGVVENEMCPVFYATTAADPPQSGRSGRHPLDVLAGLPGRRTATRLRLLAVVPDAGTPTGRTGRPAGFLAAGRPGTAAGCRPPLMHVALTV
jgi:isopentenyl-diphosphate delta-isomerase type 1